MENIVIVLYALFGLCFLMASQWPHVKAILPHAKAYMGLPVFVVGAAAVALVSFIIDLFFEKIDLA